MTKFVGVKNGRIKVVSNTRFNNSDLQIIELSPPLEQIDHNDLMFNFRLKNGKIVDKNITTPAKNIKVAFVANYGMNCGIATYSKFLYTELAPKVSECKIFAEIYDNHPMNTNDLIHCWQRGRSLTNLISAIKEYDPDIVFIQHEWGLWYDSRQWISMMSQLWNYRIIVTMHSTFYHKDKSIVETSIPEIVVHLEGAKNVLQNIKHISSKIHVIPHGCFLPEKKEKIWNFYRTDYNFMQFGFLFRYKGFENSIKATALLKDKYPNIYFTALCSENNFSKLEYENYYSELIELVNQYHLNENVGLIRGYQDDSIIDTFIKMNKVAVFPYVSNKEHECFGSSGAVPYAMSKQIPIITSTVHHFEGLPTIKAISPEEIATELDYLFSNNNIISAQVDKQNVYLNQYSWSNVANLYAKIFEN